MKYIRFILGVCVFSLIVNAPALSSDIHSEIPKFEASLSLPQLCASSIFFRGGKIEDWSYETNIYSKYAKSRGLTLERCRKILTQSIKQKTKIRQQLNVTHAVKAGRIAQFSDHCGFFGNNPKLFEFFENKPELSNRFQLSAEENDQDNVAGGYDYEQNLDCNLVKLEFAEAMQQFRLLTTKKPKKQKIEKQLWLQVKKLKNVVKSLAYKREAEAKRAQQAAMEAKQKAANTRIAEERKRALELKLHAELEEQLEKERARLEKERKAALERKQLALIEQRKKIEEAARIKEEKEKIERARLALIMKKQKEEQAKLKLERERRLKVARLARAKRERQIAFLKADNETSVAVIIGNRDYRGRIPDVKFARNDADAMRRLILEKFFYRPGNIIDLRDSTQAELRDAFGTDWSHKGRLYDYVRANESNVIVFYSGHGVPGMRDRRGYLLPIDANPNRAELTGYPLATLLKNLSKIPAKSMTVFIDACFSGESPKGMLVEAMSGLTVEIKSPMKESRKMVVVTASRGDQVASWDKIAKHGLFTKHLLEALNGAADKESKTGNKDGKVTLGEVKAYLDREMTYQARRRFSRDQNATVRGDLKTVLSAY